MPKLLLDIQNWVKRGIILECVLQCRQECYTNTRTSGCVVQLQKNISESSAIKQDSKQFFVIAFKNKIPELEKFFNDTKIPCSECTKNSENKTEIIADIKIISKRKIGRSSSDDLQLLYQCMQYTLQQFCEENWNIMEEWHEKRSCIAIDFNYYLWVSQNLYDVKLSLVPPLEMIVENEDLLNDCEKRTIKTDSISMNELSSSVESETSGEKKDQEVHNLLQKSKDSFTTIANRDSPFEVKRPSRHPCIPSIRTTVRLNLQFDQTPVGQYDPSQWGRQSRPSGFKQYIFNQLDVLRKKLANLIFF